MHQEIVRYKYLKVGQVTCRALFILGLIYAVTTLLGFLSLKSPQEPIGNPYFTIMEISTILIALLMAISMVAVHYYTLPEDKIYSLAALFLMFLMVGITSVVHFVILSLGSQGRVEAIPNYPFFFSFKWLSVAYILDILAWDWFFALSFLLASNVFKAGRREKHVRTLMIISGLLSLVGLIGVPLNNIYIRNIGIIGYAVVAPIVFLLIGWIFHKQSEALPS